MENSRVKNAYKYVLPAMLSHICFSLFSFVDGVFIGNSIGTNALVYFVQIRPLARENKASVTE